MVLFVSSLSLLVPGHTRVHIQVLVEKEGLTHLFFVYSFHVVVHEVLNVFCWYSISHRAKAAAGYKYVMDLATRQQVGPPHLGTKVANHWEAAPPVFP